MNNLEKRLQRLETQPGIKPVYYPPLPQHVLDAIDLTPIDETLKRNERGIPELPDIDLTAHLKVIK